MVDEYAQNLLLDTDRSLIEIYMDLQTHFEKKYGENTVVLIEIGSFFEVYGVDNDTEKLGKPKEIAEILNLQLTRKNKSIAQNDTKNPLLAGFPVATFERYISRLTQENKYTIVIVRQKGTPPHVSRYIDRILSPGINFDYNFDHKDNFLVSLLIEKSSDVYSIGYAAIDVTTGKTYLQELYGNREDKTLALDGVFRLLQANRTSEILLTRASENIDLQAVIEYLEISENNIKTPQRRLDNAYQNELFKKTYIINTFLSPVEFLDLEKSPLTSEALAILLEFIIEHDFSIIEKLKKPTHLSNSNYLFLGNNPLEQLNVISRDAHEMTLLKLLDHTTTSIGKRMFRERLLNPILQKDELEQRYELSESFRDIYPKIEKELQSVYDLERILRRIHLKRLHPFEINFLYDSLLATHTIYNHIENTKISDLLSCSTNEKNNLQNFIHILEKNFVFENCSKVNFHQIEGSLFHEGYDKELDFLNEEKRKREEKMEAIREKILEVLEKQTGKYEGDFVSIKQLDKEGHHITLTKSRYALIEEPLKETYLSLNGKVYAFSDFNLKIQTTNVKMTAPIIDEISEGIVLLQTKINALTKELFLKELEKISETHTELLENIIEFLSKIDVAVSNIRASIKFRLTRPEILDIEEDETFLEIQALRHPLVQEREENGIYVPNDIILGEKKYQKHQSLLSEISDSNVFGVLLYGINSSGKSSLMKSIGIAILLAQSGMFVPAESMRFGIFREIFTRIVSRDNFEKGLSSFAVEIMELKNIFNRCTPKSLILGDEISHGTETLSAISIICATILKLLEKKSLFIFTTHLHQLGNIQHIQKLNSVVSVHLSVNYDEKEDKLIFDRTLQAGSGSSIYGLEFAQSLHIDPLFLQKALQLRKELAGQADELQLLTQQKTSKYHKNLFITSCAVCQNPVDETHHIKPQKLSDKDGNIEHFHKDHKYNLLPLCEGCHNRAHNGRLIIKGFIMTSNGLELQFEEVKS
ncbi:MAG: DNA mismatch repair protein [Candidatus Magasanikbacteria bacterium CG11_big_fil_rev_8_21_14_0_20_39_34]|uniref:DNA mismatch repair protein n=1 Tax=Candidatus Magasanikbacteria bacterium CG11_big_fil_rev_8_21_14_0_20_39_34 TaxID=1974653 RepID=A0A2H0N4Q6_9BACT|nr:MAG: DNA mismatch repair protein [Candidatus Magasanikbacteria bacterium CG11_big_fil_rev_8_21_14_0_20_39_34]